MNDTTLHLTQDEAELFKLFCLHQKAFEVLYASRVFETPNSQITLHFDGQSTITKVSVTLIPYDTRTYPQKGK